MLSLSPLATWSLVHHYFVLKKHRVYLCMLAYIIFLKHWTWFRIQNKCKISYRLSSLWSLSRSIIQVNTCNRNCGRLPLSHCSVSTVYLNISYTNALTYYNVIFKICQRWAVSVRQTSENRNCMTFPHSLTPLFTFSWKRSLRYTHALTHVIWYGLTSQWVQC